MPAFRLFNRCFAPTAWMTISSLPVIVFFIWLGLWQLQRAEEKKGMLATVALLANKPPMLWKPGLPNPEQYQTIMIEGKPLSRILLLDNQHYQHHFGFHVLTPVLMDSGRLILLDRGWIPGDIDRRQFPVIPDLIYSGRTLQFSGQAYYPSDKVWVLGQTIERINRKLAVIEKIDSTLISQFLHKSVYPFIIRQKNGETGGFVREWPVVSMPPERHKAYAFQWFAMAVAILIIFVGLNLKKIDEDKDIET